MARRMMAALAVETQSTMGRGENERMRMKGCRRFKLLDGARRYGR
jgi:hypothetical protein